MGRRQMAFEVEGWFCCRRGAAAPRRGLRFPSRAGASGSRHLPWALPRILPTQPKTKRPGGGSWRAGRVTGGVCSKGANSAFILDSLGSGIAAGAAGRRRGNGRGGKAQQRYRATTTGKQKRNGQSRRYRERVRSQKPSQPEAVDETARVSLRTFFDGCCDRPGCYERFVRERRSPLQRFCSPACRRALERGGPSQADLVEGGVAARLARADGGSPRFSNESAARGAPRPARKSGLRRSGRRLKRSHR